MDFISFKVDTSYGKGFFNLLCFFFLLSLVTAFGFAAWVTMASLTPAQLALDSSLGRNYSHFQECSLKGAVFFVHRQLLVFIWF